MMARKFTTVELNRGATAYDTSNGYTGGTSLVIDATSHVIKWSNSILSVPIPITKTKQAASYNVAATYKTNVAGTGVDVITLDAGSFNAALKIGDRLLISGLLYYIITTPVGAACQVAPTPPSTGTLTAYKGTTTLLQNFRRVTETIQIEGYLFDDNKHNPQLASKQTAEQKVATLLSICADSEGSSDYINLVLRKDAIVAGRYRSTPKTGTKGKLSCIEMRIEDSKDTEDTKDYSGTQRNGAYKVSLTFMFGVPK